MVQCGLRVGTSTKGRLEEGLKRNSHFSECLLGFYNAYTEFPEIIKRESISDRRESLELTFFFLRELTPGL